MTNSGIILAIDDEADVGEYVAASARSLGLRCIATTFAAALPELLTPDVSLILLDLMMPEMDGIEAMRLLGELKCRAGIVLMSGISKRVMETAEKLAHTLGLCVVGHLTKPIQLAELEEVLKRYHILDEPIHVTPCPQVAISDERLSLAVERNEFVLHYQPQIDLASGAVIGVEALVRWQHPERGLIFPDDFIGRAAELGLIDDIGWLVADRALNEVKQFTDAGGIVLRLALNASTHSLRDLRFPDRFTSFLRNHDIAAEDIILEITESGLINELSHTLDVLARLRMKGIKLSIDDFGTGYAMMTQFKNVPATELKIDKSFVQDIIGNKTDRIMVRKAIEMGHELGMQVMAEGVETQEQLDFLSSNGCDSAQGFFFSRPIPAAKMVSWLWKNRNWPVHSGPQRGELFKKAIQLTARGA
jgi:EAL domain-containing protein (putative c-di-GMP-specific phosphodiesterase class I)